MIFLPTFMVDDPVTPPASALDVVTAVAGNLTPELWGAAGIAATLAAIKWGVQFVIGFFKRVAH